MAEPNITGSGNDPFSDPFADPFGPGATAPVQRPRTFRDRARGGMEGFATFAKGAGEFARAAREIRREAKAAARDLDALDKAAGRAGRGLGRRRGGGGAKSPVSAGSHGHPTLNNSSPDDDTSSRTNYSMDPSRSGGGFGGGGIGMYGGQAIPGRGQPGSGFAMGAMAVGQFLGGLTGSMDARIERGYVYSSSADKMSVLYQQITGMSNAQVRNTYRQPLTNYRLGETGINTLLGLQASTGILARNQASFAEGMRTLSGYSLSTEDVASMLGNLGSAQVANRMFMTTGMSLYKPGGGQRSGTELLQHLARASGLTGLRNPESALQQGSNTRMRLADMGIDQKTQDLVIQYAMANKQYQAKQPGAGMYDPSNQRQRELMGIEQNFATQMEETTRVKVNREEDFYGRQQDNFAKLEQRTQSLEKMFGRLEDRLSGIVGKGIETKSARNVLGSVLKGVGPLMSMAGAALSLTGAGAAFGAPLMVAGAVATAAGTAMGPAGDGAAGSGSRTGTPSTNATGTTTLQKVTSQQSFSRLHPTMKERVLKLIQASGGRVGFDNGYRDSAQQESMFRSRYAESAEPTDIFWDGKYWKKVRGADAAPPGRSMHEIGLAADLTGDMEWIKANAERFGLKHFANVNDEPWHVQPSELPNSRRQYEAAGAPWGIPVGARAFTPGGSGKNAEHSSSGGSGTDASLFALKGMTMSEAIRSFRMMGASGMSSSSGGGRVVAKRRNITQSRFDVPADFRNGGMAKSNVDIAQWSADFLRRVGAPVTTANLELMSAWIKAEGTRASFNPLAVVSKPRDGAEALGQWSDFNSTGVKNFANYEQGMRMNVYHMQNHAKGVLNALRGGKNPYQVAEAIERMYANWGGTTATRSVLKSRGISETGDGMAPSAPSMGTSTTSFTGGTTFNISPVINLMGSGNTQVDAQIIAREVTRIIENEMRLRELRSA